MTYYEAIESVRQNMGSLPWASWPFAPVDQVEPDRSSGVKPEQKGPPTPFSVATTTHERVKIAWEASKEEEAVAGYEIEFATVDALRGPQEWKRGYRGPKLQLRKLRLVLWEHPLLLPV